MPGAAKLVTAGGGAVNLQPASSISSDVVVQLPVVAQKLIGDKTPGTVLQVVQGTYATQGSTTSATAVATGLTASITPTSATSKILVLVSIGVQGAPGQNTAAYIYKNGSNLIFMGYPATGSAAGNSIANASYLDSPATTSSTTYAVYIGVTGGATAYWAVSNSTATITLMEIAA